MIKGSLLSIALILSLFLVVDIFEYFSWNSTLTRAIIFYSFIVLTVFVLVFYLIIPALKLLHIGKSLSEQEAAEIIGAHFPEVKDKLLNTLQLQGFNRENFSAGEVELLLAGIGQKAAELKPVPFKRAIDFKKNARYLKYALPPLLIIGLIFIIAPAFITGPAKRIVQHNTYFEKPLPYTLTVTNDLFEVLQRDDYTVKVKAEGEEIPATVFIKNGNNKFLMRESAPGEFKYTFVNVKSDIYFRLETDELDSRDYHLKVIPKPVIFNFNADLKYPRYLNKKIETIESSGDLIVPEGTIIDWQIFTRDTRNIIFKIEDDVHLLSPVKDNHFNFSKQAKNNFFYTLSPENEFVGGIDSLQFSVQVIKDEYPLIKVEDFTEKAIHGFIHFNGEIGDDHGFHSLRFFYQKDSTVQQAYQYKEIRIDAGIAQQYFNYSIRAEDYSLQPGDGLTYYFEVRDNDALNGFKRTKSPSFYLKMPEVSEIEESITESSDEIKKSLKDALKELDNIDVHELRRSDFERAFLSNYGKIVGQRLSIQYRMALPIGKLVSQCFYEGCLETGRGAPHQVFDNLPENLGKVVTWIDTSKEGTAAYDRHPNGRNSNEYSFVNLREADLIIQLIQKLVDTLPSDSFFDSTKSPEIGVICMYKEQKILIEKKIRSLGWARQLIDNASLMIDTVDGYQGKENSIIIVSLVRNNKEKKEGFLNSVNRINVALSRAKERLYIFGAADMWLSKNSNSPIGTVLSFIKEHSLGNYAIIDSNSIKGE